MPGHAGIHLADMLASMAPPGWSKKSHLLHTPQRCKGLERLCFATVLCTSSCCAQQQDLQAHGQEWTMHFPVLEEDATSPADPGPCSSGTCSFASIADYTMLTRDLIEKIPFQLPNVSSQPASWHDVLNRCVPGNSCSAFVLRDIMLHPQASLRNA